MASNHITLSTIGYESADLADFLATLQQAGIRCLVDIRQLPVSRRKGFAKKALSEALSRVEIEYIHLRGLGDPKEGREAARARNFAQFTRIFTAHMKSEIAQADLGIAIRYAAQGGACLMCYERDHAECHRRIVAEAISDREDLIVRHLGVKHGLSEQYKSGCLEPLAQARA